MSYVSYASDRRTLDRVARRVPTREYKAWLTFQQPTASRGRVVIDPADGSLWEWVRGTRRLTWVRRYAAKKEVPA